MCYCMRKADRNSRNLNAKVEFFSPEALEKNGITEVLGKQAPRVDMPPQITILLSKVIACHSGAASQSILPHLHRHHPLTTSHHNLPPPLWRDSYPSRDLPHWCPQPQQLLPPRMQLPPGGWHLDQKALIAQVVIHLAVGIGAGIGPE